MTTTTEKHPTALAGDTPDALSELEREVIDLEAKRYNKDGLKRQAMHELLVKHGIESGMAYVRFGMILNSLVDRPAAWEYAPALMKRLAKKRAL